MFVENFLQVLVTLQYFRDLRCYLKPANKKTARALKRRARGLLKDFPQLLASFVTSSVQEEEELLR